MNQQQYLKNLYSILDKVTGFHIYIFASYMDDDARRIFHSSAMPGTVLFTNPYDYQLIRLGILDEQTGSITQDTKKVIENHIIVPDNIKKLAEENSTIPLNNEGDASSNQLQQQ